jgi:hypothetical protein
MANSVSRRVTHAVVDGLGMDPLRDKSYELINTIEDWVHYTVSDSDQFNMPLIAHRTYGNPDLWWVIMVYNGIADVFTVESGMRLRIPRVNSVISRLSENNQYVNSRAVQEL